VWVTHKFRKGIQQRASVVSLPHALDQGVLFKADFRLFYHGHIPAVILVHILIITITYYSEQTCWFGPCIADGLGGRWHWATDGCHAWQLLAAAHGCGVWSSGQSPKQWGQQCGGMQ
jgi:hypothetical protein